MSNGPDQLDLAANCAVKGQSLNDNIDDLTDHILHGTQEGALRHAFEVAYTVGYMDACGAEVNRGDVIRRSYELVGDMPIGRWSERDEMELLNKTVHLADEADAITGRLTDEMMERGLDG